MSYWICEILNGSVYGDAVSTQGGVHFIPTIFASLGDESRLDTLYGAVAIRSTVSCIVDRTKEITQGQAKEYILICQFKGAIKDRDVWIKAKQLIRTWAGRSNPKDVRCAILLRYLN